MMQRDVFETDKRKTSIGDITFVKYKGVVISLEELPDRINILFVNSCNEGKGEVQETLELIKKHFPNKRLVGSVPTHPAMQHLYEKLGIEFQEA